jgi:hypothetical protein
MRSLAPLACIAASSLLAACQGPAPGEPAEAAAVKKPPSAIFEPARGVRCNRDTKVCEYRGGPTVGLTRLFFGDSEADALAETWGASGYPYDPIFKPTPWVSCDTLVTSCYEDGRASADLTRRYFGGKAASRLEKRQRQPRGSGTAVVQRGKHVACDEMSQACFDRLGAGYGATRMYLGEAEAERLLVRLQPWQQTEARRSPPPAPEPPPAP